MEKSNEFIVFKLRSIENTEILGSIIKGERDCFNATFGVNNTAIYTYSLSVACFFGGLLDPGSFPNVKVVVINILTMLYLNCVIPNCHLF